MGILKCLKIFLDINFIVYVFVLSELGLIKTLQAQRPHHNLEDDQLRLSSIGMKRKAANILINLYLKNAEKVKMC